MQPWISYLDSSLYYIGLTADDITFRPDYTVQDEYRFAIVDDVLSHPLHSLTFVTALENTFWTASEPTLLQHLIRCYGLKSTIQRGSLISILEECHDEISDARQRMPEDIVGVFEELTLFSPDLTTSIEEDRAQQDRNDSLVLYLKEHGKDVDYEKLFHACQTVFQAMSTVDAWLTTCERKPRTIPGVEGTVLYYAQHDFGYVVVGDTTDNVYHDPFALIVDLGGDDEYIAATVTQGISVIIDRQGDDRYHGDDYAIACGFFGCSIVIDEEGDDTYQAQNYSLGCGIFGCGVLLDRDGNDRYDGDTFTQGAGGFGIGILKDEKGNDIYQAALYAQGFASTYGIGILGDRAGNDMYLTRAKYTDEIRYLDHYLSLSQGFTIGFRPDLSAGLGFIFEGGGNDYYCGDIFAQGSSYWYGIGAIVDDGGNDTYSAYQYAQGAGTHITVGLLIDKKGNDNYVAKGVSQGCGHDLSFGLLLDSEGDDSYVAFDLSQGAGNANGTGLLIDESGDDTYSVKKLHNTQGYGDFRREYGSIGVLLDIKGTDTYTKGDNLSMWEKGSHGIGIDWE